MTSVEAPAKKTNIRNEMDLYEKCYLPMTQNKIEPMPKKYNIGNATTWTPIIRWFVGHSLPNRVTGDGSNFIR